MNNDEILAKEVQEWLGTPFAPNAETKGQGVSCGKLVGAIFKARGLDVEVPSGPTNLWRFSKRSIIEEFIASRTDFERLQPVIEDTMPWDIVGFRLGHIIHHLGICTRRGNFVHVFEGQGVSISSLYDATWLSRFKALWRLK